MSYLNTYPKQHSNTKHEKWFCMSLLFTKNIQYWWFQILFSVSAQIISSSWIFTSSYIQCILKHLDLFTEFMLKLYSKLDCMNPLQTIFFKIPWLVFTLTFAVGLRQRCAFCSCVQTINFIVISSLITFVNDISHFYVFFFTILVKGRFLKNKCFYFHVRL